MATRNLVINDPVGIHARPAAMFAQAVTASGQTVTIAKEGGNAVPAGSILSIMGLGIKQGDTVVINVEGDNAEAVATMIAEGGIYIEDYSHLEKEAMEIAHIDLIDEDLLKKDRTKSIIHVYISPEENPAEAISFLKERFEAVGIENTITAANCAEEDWINNWKKYFKPIPVGNRLLVRPMWEDEYEAGDRVVLHLEPGLAFGTGTHETTRLCMELLEK